jgi:NADPH:quinone reductase-like Zn-dependent oxidoreductase
LSAYSLAYSNCSLKVLCVGQNPSDYKHIDDVSRSGDWLGCDFVGEVLELGSIVPKDEIRKGEIRGGFMRGGIGKKGAFAEQVITLSFVTQ